MVGDIFFHIDKEIMDDIEKDNKSENQPGYMSSSRRAIAIFIAIMLFIYGTVGVIIDDVFVPGRRRPGTHFHGDAAWAMYGVLLCWVSLLIAGVVGHYDKKYNREDYAFFGKTVLIVSGGFFILALVLE